MATSERSSASLKTKRQMIDPMSMATEATTVGITQAGMMDSSDGGGSWESSSTIPVPPKPALG